MAFDGFRTITNEHLPSKYDFSVKYTFCLWWCNLGIDKSDMVWYDTIGSIIQSMICLFIHTARSYGVFAAGFTSHIRRHEILLDTTKNSSRFSRTKFKHYLKSPKKKSNVSQRPFQAFHSSAQQTQYRSLQWPSRMSRATQRRTLTRVEPSLLDWPTSNCCSL